MAEVGFHERLRSDSFLEHAFLRWVLTPAVHPDAEPRITPQQEVQIEGRTYRIDYAIHGDELRIAVELDGFEYHRDRRVFTYDRLRQNDLQSDGWIVLRFSYDAIRDATARCVAQLHASLGRDPGLRALLTRAPVVERPDFGVGRLQALASTTSHAVPQGKFFSTARRVLRWEPLRGCQVEALAAILNYYRQGGQHAACVMAVGAGKTTLGVAAALAYAQRRVLILTPGSVIRGTFDRALDVDAPGNSLYGLPGGPLIAGVPPPATLTLDPDTGPINQVSHEDLLRADFIVTNFHALGDSDGSDGLLAKLGPEDVDLIVVDEAHIAAADSYQRCFQHFARARTLLMSACFQRMDGRSIDADVVYRYRLVDAIADGHAKTLQMHRFEPRDAETVFDIHWPDGRVEEIVGRDALLRIIDDERKLARITARSDESILHVVRVVAARLAEQRKRLRTVRPRVLFAAMGERHADQIARVANELGVRTESLHHTMPSTTIRALRDRFEREGGDLDALVHLRMLGQGYDHPPITVVVPMRPYGSFGEFYQFLGRGVRAIRGRDGGHEAAPSEQVLDIVFHAELMLEEHFQSLQREDFDPLPGTSEDELTREDVDGSGSPLLTVIHSPNVVVVQESGVVVSHPVHDVGLHAKRQDEREREALAQQYARYAQANLNPVPFEQFVRVMRSLRG